MNFETAKEIIDKYVKKTELSDFELGCIHILIFQIIQF
jgi:hypothetical protein